MDIVIPSRALVLTVGASGSGKSTFAANHFPDRSIVSSDECRAMVCDDARVQECNRQAFDLFHRWIDHRLSLGKLTVADATNLKPSARKALYEIAARHQTPVIILLFMADESVCQKQNTMRDRFVPTHVIANHSKQLTQAVVELARETYSTIYTIYPHSSVRVAIQSGYREFTAPGFDVIGDIHGCYDELRELLERLGYGVGEVSGGDGCSYVHPEGRKLVFLGDYTDRGPKSVAVLREITLALEGGHIGLMGNHDNKLMRALRGNKVKMAHGLAETWAQLQECSEAERTTFYEMLSSLPYQVKLTVPVPGTPALYACHAGLPKRLIGKDNSEARNHAIYGEVVGQAKLGEYPTRGTEYANDWPLGAHNDLLIHGHTVVSSLGLLVGGNNVIDIDTGCAFGQELTAFRWPEKEVVSVEAKEVYRQKPELAEGQGIPAPHIEEGVVL